jgi:hypothetical protein
VCGGGGKKKMEQETAYGIGRSLVGTRVSIRERI